MDDWVIRVPVYEPVTDFWDTFKSPKLIGYRTEQLKKATASIEVDPRALAEDPDRVKMFVTMRIRRMLENACRDQGRMFHGDVVLESTYEHLRDVQVFHGWVKTRESDQGQWPAVWAAIREDEEDRREALRHPADDLDG